MPGACPVAGHVGRVAGGAACPRWGAFRGEGPLWRRLRPVEGVVQRFRGCFWGVGDADGELQAVPSAWWGRDLVLGGVCCCPSDVAVVVPFHCPPDVPVFEDVDLCGGRGAFMASQLTSWIGRTWGWVFGGARLLRMRWMSSAAGPASGASCAAWARGGEGGPPRGGRLTPRRTWLRSGRAPSALRP